MLNTRFNCLRIAENSIPLVNYNSSFPSNQSCDIFGLLKNKTVISVCPKQVANVRLNVPVLPDSSVIATTMVSQEILPVLSEKGFNFSGLDPKTKAKLTLLNYLQLRQSLTEEMNLEERERDLHREWGSQQFLI
ncbi:hypothetical protein TNIN_411071 [Trichonephila inaurata madagascariensis]|uniref:Uncharacterized protein n=1 Tax=Trichonephila inaurata madagascariensis TaxID=2747483 RepID=A0A8X6M5S8_9ARAC|nr:hypothetical protein TNIN_411071 [Trichonephila inaurata madagascariensis]